MAGDANVKKIFFFKSVATTTKLLSSEEGRAKVRRGVGVPDRIPEKRQSTIGPSWETWTGFLGFKESPPPIGAAGREDA